MAQDLLLKLRIVGAAKGATQRKRHPKSARRTHRFGLFADQADRSSGDASAFDKVRQGTYGARANGSDRHEESDVNAVGRKQRANLLAGCL